MYDNQYLLKHLLFIVGNLPASRRYNLEIIPLAGISNPDIEISLSCISTFVSKYVIFLKSFSFSCIILQSEGIDAIFLLLLYKEDLLSIHMILIQLERTS